MFLEVVDRVLEAVISGLSLFGVGRVTTDCETVSTVVVDEGESFVVLEDFSRLFLLLLVELNHFNRVSVVDQEMALKSGRLTITSSEALLKRKGTDLLLRASISLGTSRSEG